MKKKSNIRFEKIKLHQILLITFILLVFSCKKDKTDHYAIEKARIAKYVAENSITVEPKSNGLYFIEKEEEIGSGDYARFIVSIRYRGFILGDNGELTEFDNNMDASEPMDVLVGAGYVIPGVEQGLSYMRMGGKATLIIPFDYAYGSGGSKDAEDNYVIPPYSTLIFEIELVNVQ
jgi:peptidylprolyl isomerase